LSPAIWLRLWCSVGSGLPACRRASARRRAGEGKFLGQRSEPCLDRIPFYVVFHPLAFFVVADQVIVAFILPEGAGTQTKHPDGFVSSKAFERPEPFSRRHAWRDQQMNVVRHHNKRVQLVAVEPAFAVAEGLDNHFSYFGSAEKRRPTFGVIEQAIHGDERLPCCEVRIRESTVNWKASVQPECHEHLPADDVPMREAAVVPAHFGCSAGKGGIVSRSLVIGCAGRKPGGRAEAPPHSAGVGEGWCNDERF
jgi:hypothetical protein